MCALACIEESEEEKQLDATKCVIPVSRAVSNSEDFPQFPLLQTLGGSNKVKCFKMAPSSGHTREQQQSVTVRRNQNQDKVHSG